MPRQETMEQAIRNYEGLIFTTTILIKRAGVEMDIDDIRALLRIKVWRTLVAFDDKHASGLKRDNFVNGCLMNFKKDLLKRPRRYEQSIEELRSRRSGVTAGDTQELGEWFDARFLTVSEEEAYGGVDGDDLSLPSTLDAQERQVVALLYGGATMREVDLALGLSRAHRERIVRSIRARLADWRPSREHVPTPPLPLVELHVPRARDAQSV